MIKTIIVCAKAVDSCHITIVDENDKDLVEPKHDYVPQFLDIAGEDEPGYGDYIQLSIDFETGKILNWESKKKDVEKYIETGGRIFE